ncbi:hypothetical protein ACO0QE_000923 [Hanseniaspora vineae]
MDTEYSAQEIDNPNSLLQHPNIRTLDAFEDDDINSTSNISESPSSNNDNSHEQQIRDMASELLRNKVPPFISVLYKNLEFRMFRNDLTEEQKDDNEDPVPYIFENASCLNENGRAFFTNFRRRLSVIAPSAELDSKEIVIFVPALNITLNEDNLYNNSMSFKDIVTLFGRFCENSKLANTKMQYNNLLFQVNLQERFFVRFNELIEIMENAGTFEQLGKFTNDEANPLLVDDDIEGDDNIDNEGDVEVISD